MKFLTTILLTLLTLLSMLPAWAAETLTLGVFAYRPKPVIEARYKPLADYLSSQLKGTQVKLEVMEREEMEEAVAMNRLDLVLTNPSHYLILRSKNTLTGALATIVSHEAGQSTNSLGGVIITLPNRRDITQLKDLKNQRIAIPGFKFFGGYQAQSYELFQMGIDLPSQASLIEVGTHDAVIQAVQSGKAGLIKAHFLLDHVQFRHILHNAGHAPFFRRICADFK